MGNSISNSTDTFNKITNEHYKNIKIHVENKKQNEIKNENENEIKNENENEIKNENHHNEIIKYIEQKDNSIAIYTDKLNNKKYGWIPDLPDFRDIYYVKKLAPKDYPKQIDLRYNCPNIYNQNDLKCCTSHCIICLIEYNEKKYTIREVNLRKRIIKIKEETNSTKLNIFTPSRLFMYYNERKNNGTLDYDSGGSLRNAIKIVKNIGLCNENIWNYDTSKYKDIPHNKCFDEVKKYKSIKYYRLKHIIIDMKSCLLEGYPFAIGISIYESFNDAHINKTGIVPIPKNNEKLLGGHSVIVVGYNDNYGFLIRNSWGENWGLNGYCYIPFDYISDSNLTQDLWTIRTELNN